MIVERRKGRAGNTAEEMDEEGQRKALTGNSPRPRDRLGRRWEKCKHLVTSSA